MPFELHNLDNRRFQDFVNEAKEHIARYCPEWTDHNVSDPGITLIELFASMADQLIYRVNKLPENVQLTLLNLLDIRRREPQSAYAPITFYLTRAQPGDVVIKRGREVATLRTESETATVFTTEDDLTVHPTGSMVARTRFRGVWLQRDLRLLEDNALIAKRDERHQLLLFADKKEDEPQVNDAFYLGFAKDLSHHVLALTVRSVEAEGMGVRPKNPPWAWEVWQGSPVRWAPCEVEHDGTGGFSYPAGEIILHLPRMALLKIEVDDAYWLRCRLEAPSSATGRYSRSPMVEALQAETRGVTVQARHAIVMHDEVLGTSSGQPGQIFRLRHSPVLSRDPEHEHLIVRSPDGLDEQHWEERSDFADSGSDDKHYTLDSFTGTITLGPQLRLPNGDAYCFGAIPDRGSELRFSQYRYGGGAAGNVDKHTLTVLKSAHPLVARVTNRDKARGGRDPESVDLVKLRAPKQLRLRSIAVTADDYIYHAQQLPGVARAHCISPGDGPNAPPVGQVVVLVLPQIDQSHGYPGEGQMEASPDLRALAEQKLGACSPLGVRVQARSPRFVFVAVRTRLRIAPGSSSQAAQRDTEELLRNYLNPYVGGPQGNGWPFGRPLHRREIEGLLQRIEGVEFIVSLDIVSRPPSTDTFNEMRLQLDIQQDELICSVRHTIEVV